MKLKDHKIHNKDPNDRQNTSSSSVRSSNTFNKNNNKHSITSVK